MEGGDEGVEDELVAVVSTVEAADLNSPVGCLQTTL